MSNDATDRAEALADMKRILDGAEGRKLTASERHEFDNREAFVKSIDIRTSFNSKNGSAMNGIPEIRGEANEKLSKGQSVREYVKRASANGVSFDSVSGGYAGRGKGNTDFDTKAYWGARLGFCPPNAETRALGEDTSSGSGAGAAVSPQTWSADVIDYLYAATILGRVGATVVPMANEQVNVPQFTATVAPTWVAENGSISLDATPAFSTLALTANGGIKDITLISLELAQDAYVQGGLGGFLAQFIARKVAVSMDLAALYGVAGATGLPGMINESGFVTRVYTGDGGSGVKPIDTTELSVIAALARTALVEPNAFVMSPALYGLLHRQTGTGGYPGFFPTPEDAAMLDQVATTSVGVAETYAGAQTGGALTSIYCGDWSRVIVGVRLDLSTTVLRERYVDSGQVGLFSFMRTSIRTSHPESFTRTKAVKLS